MKLTELQARVTILEKEVAKLNKKLNSIMVREEDYIANLLGVNHNRNDPFDIIYKGQRIEIKASSIYKFKLQPNGPYDWLILIRQWREKGIVYRRFFLLTKEDVKYIGLNHIQTIKWIRDLEVTEEQLVERINNA
jgi:hypothetical protein